MTEVRSSSSGGHGLFATKDFKVGDTILEEAATLARLLSIDSTVLRDNVRFQKTDRPKEEEDGLVGDSIHVPNSVDNTLAPKFRAMVQAALSGLDMPETDAIFDLYFPSIEAPSEKETTIVSLSQQVLDYFDNSVVSGSKLEIALKERKSTLQKIMLVWACNSFEGGRIYHVFSRVNHSCDPNAIVQANGEKLSLRAACAISSGDEITFSYLHRPFLYADKPVRRKLLEQDKFFDCKCRRCGDFNDKAFSIPCPLCHPREGAGQRQLSEDVQYDDEKVVKYARRRQNGTISCDHCSFVFFPDQKNKNLSEHVRLMDTCNSVSDRVVSYLQERERDLDILDDDVLAVRQEQLGQQISIASSVLGAQHWATNMLLLTQLETSLKNYHASVLDKDSTMDNDDALETVAEAIDTLQRVCSFMVQMEDEIRFHSGHLLSDVVISAARALVSLGDVKSMKYAAEWLAKIDGFVDTFESEAMKKVVKALSQAYKRAADATGGAPPEKRFKHE